MTYATAKFEVARSRYIYKNYIIWPLTLTLVSQLHEMLPKLLDVATAIDMI